MSSSELPRMPDESVRAVCAAIGPVAAAWLRERLGAAPDEALGCLRAEVIESPELSLEVTEGRVLVSTGLLREVHRRAAQLLPPPERPLFRARAFGIALAGRIVEAFGAEDEADREAQATAILERSELGRIAGFLTPVTDIERRAARALWTGERAADDE